MHKIFLKQTNKKKTFKKLLRAKTDIVECSLRAYDWKHVARYVFSYMPPILHLIIVWKTATKHSRGRNRISSEIMQNFSYQSVQFLQDWRRYWYKPKHMLFLKYVLILSYFSLYQSLASNIQKLSVEPNSYLICSCCTKVNIVRETTVNIL